MSLVEKDRQWFKARVGFEACETPIEQSVCAHSLASPNLLIIPDLTLDPRTSTNTLVTEPPHIRFYAGAPLVGPDGVTIGTLCVIDTKPRPDGLTLSQQKMLAALSRQVIALLEHRRMSNRKDVLFRRQKNMSATIRSHVNKTIAAQEAGRIGTFDIDIETGVATVSAEFCRLFDVAVQPTYPASTFEALLLPSDRGIQSTDESRADGSAETNVEYRIKTATQGIRWISRHAVFERNDEGRPIKMLGTAQDITDLKRAALRTEALLDLGDRLRDLDDTSDMALVAADLMGKAFDATHAGFGIVDTTNETVTIHAEWHRPGVPRSRASTIFATMDHTSRISSSAVRWSSRTSQAIRAPHKMPRRCLPSEFACSSICRSSITAASTFWPSSITITPILGARRNSPSSAASATECRRRWPGSRLKASRGPLTGNRPSPEEHFRHDPGGCHADPAAGDRTEPRGKLRETPVCAEQGP
ncbi:PAS domain-containing protein [Aliirhizobium terrae]|nr:GAF domain-containing protein [Rhizobium sp. CC-CFT758]WJH40491.1 PAS domain-containing protein [Rhizobium sp. CC-CFT758]